DPAARPCGRQGHDPQEHRRPQAEPPHEAVERRQGQGRGEGRRYDGL
ncbi:MAG: hypothetical protein AVDCRST_MAG64-1421, partial [uncultured Phycisphaerae bacterium]